MKRNFFGIRTSALFEMLLFFLITLAIDLFLGNGNRFNNAYPHPFWLIVLLITIQYGTSEGLVCSVLASIFLLVGNIPEQQLHQTIYDYLLYIAYRPLLWCGSAILFGQLSSRHIFQKEKLREAIIESREHEALITESYNKLKAVKEMLEVQIASQLKGVSVTYEAIKSLEIMDQSLILSGLVDVVRKILKPHKFSIYSFGANGFEAISCSGWQSDESFATRFAPDSVLYQNIIKERQLICVVNAEHAKILNKEGVLAAPLINPFTNEIFGMLKIEEIEFLELNLSNIAIFKNLCDVVGTAYANANKYQLLYSDSIRHFESGVLSYKTFEFQSQLLQDLNINQAILKVNINNVSHFSHNHYYLFLRLFVEKLKEKLPPTARIFIGRRSNYQLIILFPNTSLAEAKSFIALFNELKLSLKEYGNEEFLSKVEFACQFDLIKGNQIKQEKHYG